MRRLAFLLAAVFLLGIGTPAQDNSQTLSFSASPSRQPDPSLNSEYTMSLPEWLAPTPPVAASPEAASASNNNAQPAPDAPAQGVFGVRAVYPFQAYIGYTFVRFYEVPGQTVNLNGFNYSIVYYPEDRIAADGEFVLALGDQYPYQARFLLGMGGARIRFRPFPRNIDVWGHALAGGTHFTPQTPYGKQGAFAYELGGGVDINLSHVRYAIRAGADMVGTRYFGTNQFSPKISIGFVYKF